MVSWWNLLNMEEELTKLSKINNGQITWTHFAKEDIQMAGNPMKRRPASLVIRWTQIKTQCDTTSHPLDTYNQTPDRNKCRWGCGETRMLAHAWSEWKMKLLWKTLSVQVTYSCAPDTCIISLASITPINAIPRKNKLTMSCHMVLEFFTYAYTTPQEYMHKDR